MAFKRKVYAKVSRKKKAYKKKRFYKKKLFSIKRKKTRVSRKKYYKKVGKILQNATNYTQPYTVLQTNDAFRVGVTSNSTFGQSTIATVECGLANVDITVPTDIKGIWNGNFDDLAYAVYTATGSINSRAAMTTYDRTIMIEKNKWKACLRNNSTVGCYMKVYRVKPRKTMDIITTTSRKIYDRLLDCIDNSGTNEPTHMNYQTTLYDFPDVVADFVLKKIDERILYPGETTFYNLKCPIAGRAVKVADAMEKCSDSRWHRALVFQFHGLPGHDSTGPDWTSDRKVVYAPISVDFIVNGYMKVRQIYEPTKEDNKLASVTQIDGGIAVGNIEVQALNNAANSIVGN